MKHFFTLLTIFLLIVMNTTYISADTTSEGTLGNINTGDTVSSSQIPIKDSEFFASFEDGTTFTHDDLDSYIGYQAFQLKYQLHNLRANALMRLVVTQVLEDEAKQHNLSVDDLLEKEVEAQSSNISDDMIDGYLAGQQSTLINKDKDLNIKAQRIQARIALSLQLRKKYRQQLVSRLIKSRGVSVSIPPSPQAPVETVSEVGGPLLGNPEATNTVVLFSDYNCPYCAMFDKELRAFVEANPNEVKVIFRHLPLQGHSEAEKLAEAAMCIHEQDSGLFWTFSSKVFENKGTSAEDIPTLATQIGANLEALDQCLMQHTYAERIKLDKDEANRLGITATPTFFINGIRQRGMVKRDRLQQLLTDNTPPVEIAAKEE